METSYSAINQLINHYIYMCIRETAPGRARAAEEEGRPARRQPGELQPHLQDA